MIVISGFEIDLFNLASVMIAPLPPPTIRILPLTSTAWASVTLPLPIDARTVAATGEIPINLRALRLDIAPFGALTLNNSDKFSFFMGYPFLI